VRNKVCDMIDDTSKENNSHIDEVCTNLTSHCGPHYRVVHN